MKPKNLTHNIKTYDFWNRNRVIIDLHYDRLISDIEAKETAIKIIQNDIYPDVWLNRITEPNYAIILMSIAFLILGFILGHILGGK